MASIVPLQPIKEQQGNTSLMHPVSDNAYTDFMFLYEQCKYFNSQFIIIETTLHIL